MDFPETVTRAVLSKTQHKAALWADPATRVHAVVMAARMPAVAALPPGQVAEADCLQPGLLAPEAARRASWLLRLDPRSPFTDWLLFEAAAELGEWGVLVASGAAFVPLRNRLRGLAEARLPDGSTVPLDWMDPTLLRFLLPLCDGLQLSEVFGGGVAALGIAEPRALTLFRAPLGRLVATSTAIAAGAA